MTRIIKKSKKKRIEEPEVEPVEEGKDLSQSGNFFQNNKSNYFYYQIHIFLQKYFQLSLEY